MDATNTAESPSGKVQPWWRRPSPLGITFVAVVALSIGKQIAEAWPHPPRVVVENRCPDTIDHLVVEGPSGTSDLGPLPPRGRAPLAIEFRRGETYVIQGHEVTGDELVRQLGIAREERRDVLIRILWNVEGYAEVYLGGFLPLADPDRKSRQTGREP